MVLLLMGGNKMEIILTEEQLEVVGGEDALREYCMNYVIHLTNKKKEDDLIHKVNRIREEATGEDLSSLIVILDERKVVAEAEALANLEK